MDFLEKVMGQVCPATVGLGRFDSEGASGKIRCSDCPLRNLTIRAINFTEIIDLQ
jgi:hypothetical protein